MVTKQEYDTAVAGFHRSGNHALYDERSDAEALQQFKDSMSVLPPPAPDLADETIQRARQAARRRLLMGGLTGPLDLTGASLAKPPPGLTGI
jgi:hypothetical protein